MKVYAISDLHLSINNSKPMNIFGPVWNNYLNTVKESLDGAGEDDLILHAGDLSWAMKLKDAQADFDYLASLPGKKIITRGNHDYWWESISAVRSALPESVFAIQNDCLRFGNALVFGSRGWSLEDGDDHDKAMINRELIRLKLSLDAMQRIRTPEDKTFCMIHYPPFNVKFESSVFTDLIESYNVDYCIYGHLHGKGCRAAREIVRGNTKYLLTSCDLVDMKAVFVCEI